MAEKPRKSGAAGAKKKRRGIWFRLLRICMLLVVVLLAVPPLQVLYVKYRDPHWIPLMTLRRMEDRREGQKPRPARHEWRNLEDMPVFLVRCVIVSEDARFLSHEGIDWIEMKAAMQRSGRGASTISMQCARTVFLWQGRSWIRKGIEAYYTLCMEKILSKRRILELYLNTVETGKGVYGMAAGADAHFRKDLRDLERGQMAFLAALLPAPTKWDPNRPSPKLRWKQALILKREEELRFPAAELMRGEEP